MTLPSGRTWRDGTQPAADEPARSGSFAADLAEYRSLMRRVYAAVREVSGARVLLDNTKGPAAAGLLSGAPGIDLRVLHLVRLSYGVSYSWSRMTSVEFDGPVMHRCSPARSAAEWLAYNGLFDLLAAARLPRLLLRYEDFIRAPRQVLLSVLDFLDLPVPDDDLAFLTESHADLAADHSLWGNPMRMLVGPQELRLDEGWRTGLSRESQLVVGALTLPGLLRYGYGYPGRRAAPARTSARR